MRLCVMRAATFNLSHLARPIISCTVVDTQFLLETAMSGGVYGGGEPCAYVHHSIR